MSTMNNKQYIEQYTINNILNIVVYCLYVLYIKLKSVPRAAVAAGVPSNTRTK